MHKHQTVKAAPIFFFSDISYLKMQLAASKSSLLVQTSVLPVFQSNFIHTEIEVYIYRLS